MHKISVQTADWYNRLFDENENPEAAFRFIKDCGFDSVDYNLDHTMPPFAELSKGIRNDYFDAPVEEVVARYEKVKAAAEKVGVSFAQAHAPFPMNVDSQPEHPPVYQKTGQPCVLLAHS